jgi:hypothetical protein
MGWYGPARRLREEVAMMKNVRNELGSLGWLIRTLTMAAIAGAIYKEMRLPAEERTWHGQLLGFVPYDFRLPTPRRMIDAFWNPRSPQLFQDQPFGVGWAVNVPAALRLLGRLRRRAQATRPARTRTAKTAQG